MLFHQYGQLGFGANCKVKSSLGQLDQIDLRYAVTIHCGEVVKLAYAITHICARHKKTRRREERLPSGGS